ncbi:bifunctional 4-hydroxy-2-oxoglutarate aldolase/2-dehydro-3-deoxy-phosphogluconate aldolase [Planctomicrobium piriforme]|uniref:2-dehydro-3-deoxyphosphogluconate aldolase / (4S)-4-hydroxy-2-oxoglutarate aldolase n=1 Tax=Planctomicrobium piriforme TaxID=1576369 RepID=A0A1I3N780_9PLAN|nr:bifunctional 4-hydroxy-2-oxoglutarate aldolase/2-dehydro-3-deoxy-phosphogluconate aldolase [Planctomicrobium piriforme]SFJ05087.1 2-dehydro-3-deoxyphosphogluconate aldolase / (4S)-4-hydroxy-2-oxoglutarate aldolase [Planctomicrobium piriforme]
MSKDADLRRVLDLGLVAIIRASSGDQLLNVSKALLAGGIDVIEVTFTVPGALQIIQQISKELGGKILLGAGTVLDPETARAALLAGAEFIVTPVVNIEVIQMCQRYGKLCMAGAFTPTEILTAWQAGADIVKVFPAEIGGPNYLKILHGPLPQVRLLPTGGVNLDTLPAFVKAGACAVGLGSSLVEKEALAKGDMQRIQTLAAAYVQKMHECRTL